MWSHLATAYSLLITFLFTNIQFVSHHIRIWHIILQLCNKASYVWFRRPSWYEGIPSGTFIPSYPMFPCGFHLYGPYCYSSESQSIPAPRSWEFLVSACLFFAPYTYDVRENLGILDPSSSCHCHTHATYQCYCVLFSQPPQCERHMWMSLNR